MASNGCCDESYWPYIPLRFKTKPSSYAYQMATKHKAIQYLSLKSLTEVKQCLASGYPVVFGFQVPESFESDVVAKTGILPMSDANTNFVGGHAVLAVGYDDTIQKVLVRNSWGTSWGLNGYFWMPYGFFTSIQNLVSDMWSIQKVTKQ